MSLCVFSSRPLKYTYSINNMRLGKGSTIIILTDRVGMTRFINTEYNKQERFLKSDCVTFFADWAVFHYLYTVGYSGLYNIIETLAEEFKEVCKKMAKIFQYRCAGWMISQI